MTTHEITENIIIKLQIIPLDKQKQIVDYIESIVEESLLTLEKSESSPKKKSFGIRSRKNLDE